MRVLCVLLVVSCVVAAAVAQVPANPGVRPPTRSRLQSMFNDVMGDMSSMASRLRNGFTRTFSSSRSGNLRPQEASFRNPPSVDPALETNEIAPARQSLGDAPNAPGFTSQNIRRPPPQQGGAAFNLRRVVDRMVGGMRNVFQGFNRRGGPTRRIQEQPHQPLPIQQQHHQQG